MKGLLLGVRISCDEILLDRLNAVREHGPKILGLLYLFGHLPLKTVRDRGVKAVAHELRRVIEGVIHLVE